MAKADPGTRTDDELTGRIAELEALLLLANDAALGMAGIIGSVLVESGLIGREALAAIIDHRAGSTASADHNPLLRTLARAIRMNLPGGRFDVIEGGAGSAARG